MNKTAQKKSKTLSPRQAPSMWAEFNKQMADAKAHLARVEQLVRRDRVRFVHVPETTVRTHTRAAHWRPYYPALVTKTHR